jgi:hypothetical protein
MKPDSRYAGAIHNAPEIPLNDVVRVKRFPIGLAEDQSMILIF